MLQLQEPLNLDKTKPRSKKQPTRTQQANISAFHGYYELSLFKINSSFLTVKPGFAEYKAFWSFWTTTKKTPGQTHPKALTDSRPHHGLTSLFIINAVKVQSGSSRTGPDNTPASTRRTKTIRQPKPCLPWWATELQAALRSGRRWRWWLSRTLFLRHYGGMRWHTVELRNHPRATHLTPLPSTAPRLVAAQEVPGCPAVTFTSAPGAAHHPSLPSGEQHRTTPSPSPQAFTSDVLPFQLQTTLTTFSVPLAVRSANSKCPSGVYRAWEGCNYLSCNNKMKSFYILLVFHCFPLTMTYLKARIILFRSHKRGQKFFLCTANLSHGCIKRCV